MSTNKKKNPLGFTDLDYDTLRDKVQKELDKDPRFETSRDSSIIKTVLDMFCATTDITNYNIERRAEESYFDTARLRSSVIALSRNLGYTPTRRIPSRSGLSIVFKGPLPNLVAGDTVTFYKATHNNFNTFNGSDMSFMLKYTYTYTFTQDDVDQGNFNPNWTKEVKYGVNLSASDQDIPIDNQGNVDTRYLLDIELMQGKFINEVIYGANNPQTGQLFQKYKINDPTFSNYYGEEDLGYNTTTFVENRENNLTRLGIGTSRDNAWDNLYGIRRKSLIDPNEINLDLSDIPEIVLFLTNQNEGITMYFGDDIFARKGLNAETSNIYVRYLSTRGASGNKVGVIGQEITSNDTFITDVNGIDITNNIEFKFSRNVTNGTDMESISSIKLNAPEIFYSLDRLVTIRDYISYLKTQTVGDTGGIIKNALAWGEQEEVRRRGQTANFRFYNVIFFSVLGSIYNFISNSYNIKNETQIHDAYLEQSEDFSTVTESTSGVVSADGYPEQSYFNVLVKEQPQEEIERVEDFRNINADHPISQMYTKLEKRSQVTIRHIYISPIVQKMKLKGRVTIGKLEDRSTVQRKINNNIYTWLDDNADFNVDIQKSPIIDIISNEPEVVSTNIYFEPDRPLPLISEFSADTDMVDGTLSADYSSVESIFTSAINDYLTSAGFANPLSTESSNTSALLSIYDVPDVSSATLVQSASTLPTSASSTAGIWNNPYSDGTFVDYWFEYKAHLRSGFINEYSFYNTLVKNIYNGLSDGAYQTPDGEDFNESQYFKNIVYKLHNDLLPVIRSNMIDSEGNVNIYSLGNEIAQVEIDLSYVYETE